MVYHSPVKGDIAQVSDNVTPNIKSRGQKLHMDTSMRSIEAVLKFLLDEGLKTPQSTQYAPEYQSCRTFVQAQKPPAKLMRYLCC